MPERTENNGACREERTGLHSLYLEGAFEGGCVTDFGMHAAPGEHARAWVETRRKREEAEEWMCRELDGVPVAVRGTEGEILFCGPIEKVSVAVRGADCVVSLELVSGSRFLDLLERSCSYQDGSFSYRRIMQETAEEIPGGAAIFSGNGKEMTGQPVIRCQETAWEFLGRLASHLGLPLVPDIRTTGAARIYIGLPCPDGDPVTWEEKDITGVCQDSRFLELGGAEAGLVPAGFLRYDLEGGRPLSIGQEGMVRGRKLRVVGVDAESCGGEVVFTYHVAAAEYCLVPRKENRRLKGMSLLGTVTKRAGEDIWVHLDIDGERESADEWGWPWTPLTGNLLYLMPVVGSRVSLYFGSADERSGRGIHCITQTGGDPRERWLRTEHGKSLELLADEMNLKSEDGGNSIRMYGNCIHLRGERASLFAAGELSIEGSRVLLRSAEGSIRIGRGPVVETEEGSTVDTRAYIGIDAQGVEVCGEASVRMLAESGPRYAPYPDGPEEGKFNYGKEARRAAVSVAVIGGTAVLVCASMGAATPVLVGAGTTAVLAGGGQFVGDVMRGEVGNYEDYIMAVGGAELMFFTNLAMTQVIAMTGMGFVTGTLLKDAGMAAAEAGLDLAVEGEINYERLAVNMAGNVFVDLGMGLFVDEMWGGVAEVEGGSETSYARCIAGLRKPNSSVQTISNRFPNDNQVGKRFNYTTEGGVQNVDFVIDMDGNLHIGRGYSYLAGGSSVQPAE